MNFMATRSRRRTTAAINGRSILRKSRSVKNIAPVILLYVVNKAATRQGFRHQACSEQLVCCYNKYVWPEANGLAQDREAGQQSFETQSFEEGQGMNRKHAVKVCVRCGEPDNVHIVALQKAGAELLGHTRVVHGFEHGGNDYSAFFISCMLI